MSTDRQAAVVIRDSSLVIPSSFVIRHQTFEPSLVCTVGWHTLALFPARSRVPNDALDCRGRIARRPADPAVGAARARAGVARARAAVARHDGRFVGPFPGRSRPRGRTGGRAEYA